MFKSATKIAVLSAVMFVAGGAGFALAMANDWKDLFAVRVGIHHGAEPADRLES